MTDDPSTLIAAAFPSALRRDALTIADIVPRARFAPVAPFTAVVDGESVVIPNRIYADPSAPDMIATLTPTRQAILNCWYTRHHDGFVRQRHIERVIDVTLPWVAPFIVALIGE